MGSYLSIVNNTQDRWQCKIGPDEAALKIAGIIIGVVGTLATVIGTAGGAAPLAASLAANGVVSVLGVSTSALASITAGATAVSSYASVIGGVSGFSMSVAKGITDQLNKDSYTAIEPGKSNRWGKMSLSLWQQGTCVKTVNVDEKTVRTETLYMRPIFSGGTDNSNNDHQIQFWVDKWGTEKQEIVSQDKAQRYLTENGQEVSEDELIYFFANGTNTYHGDA
ncbi:hypothetical protein Poli38472_000262 [Pythium oligandrum]|uniref:Uncharacterized protein n=1 Tax=Pythium oligandrum TaxID=41045 RepID=A0A8K1CBS6_PYTOL|nr:hypothetical protein Poli38472_000262 [Pythium oligandrum]|eukprot:TMW60220.1 hypothetical protein Poli38472_000262 [Pythium oligandrum]